MRTFAVVVCLLILGCCLVSSNAVGQLITPVSQDSYVYAGGGGYGASGGVIESSSDFSPFVGYVGTNIVQYNTSGFNEWQGTASQNSEIDASSIIASGSEQSFIDMAGEGEEEPLSSALGSVFSVLFQIAGPCSYSLTGSVYAVSMTGGSEGMFAGVYLSDTNEPPALSLGWYDDIGGPQQSFSTNGTLAAGEYEIYGAVEPIDTIMGSQGSYSLDLELSPVPEPSTAILVGMSVLGLILGSRRLHQRSS